MSSKITRIVSILFIHIWMDLIKIAWVDASSDLENVGVVQLLKKLDFAKRRAVES